MMYIHQVLFLENTPNLLYPGISTFFEWVWYGTFLSLLGYTIVTKAHVKFHQTTFPCERVGPGDETR